ncbi:hypothetical protein V499_01506 [Pseudogymnoascus sp. VKM F-103]|nr:hypothetical protein V499_01506 [Pseudogymnoascus sp. VKM F-103]
MHRRKQLASLHAGNELRLDSGYNSQSESESETVSYRRKIADFSKAGVNLSNHGDDTKIMIARAEKFWALFWAKLMAEKEVAPKDEDLDFVLGDNPSEALAKGEAPIFKAYLCWRYENSRITKESSIMTYWKTLSMLYAQWIPQYLELDTSEKEKYALFVDDLCNLQHGNWVNDTELYPHERLRVQESLLMDFGGCTSSRPKALVGKRPLLYSDITFHLFPSMVKGKRPIIVMTLNLKHIKRSGGKSKKKKFTFYEGEDLSCCAVSFMLALALADNAFKNEFKSLRDIYNLVVPPDADRITLEWDDEWAERPVFRDVEVTANGVRISKTKSFQYAKYRYYFVRLGRVMGYEKALELYGLRRGSGKELNDALTPEERRHIMGNSGDVYERYYMPDFVDKDCQGIYLGTPRRDDLIRRVGRLARHGRCPSSLTDEQKLEIKNHPDIVKAATLRNTYGQEIKLKGYTTIKAAQGTKLFEQHKEAQANINNLRRQLSDALLEKTIKEFHINVHTDEVNRQMQGIYPADALTSPPKKYELKERAAIVKMLGMSLNDLDEDQVIEVRITFVDNLALICNRQECPRKYKGPKLEKKQSEHLSNVQKLYKNETIVSVQQIQGPDLTCDLCKSDEEAGPAKKDKVFKRIDILQSPADILSGM